jgi:hypothetical protein
LRGIDAGVYTPEDLRAQPARPGTADLVARHLLLWGDPLRADAVLPPAARDIDPSEALYLLENRAWDVAGAASTDAAQRRLQQVLALKATLDIAAAHHIVAGADPAWVSDPAAALAAGHAKGLPPAVAEAAARAGRWRVSPDGAAAEDAAVALERICGAWISLAGRVLDIPDASVRQLVAQRCETGWRFANLREFVRMARARGMSRATGLARGLACSGSAPRATVRVHALVRGFMRRADPAQWRQHTTRVERITAALGILSGSLDERARQAWRAGA